VTWSAPASLADLADEERAAACGLGAPFARELAAGRYLLAPSGVSHHLVVHGESDDVVPVEHGLRLHRQARPPRDLCVIPGGDHRLIDPGHRRHAVSKSLGG
jgi:fermentation-respiration switch protein FrsA (DUF1100 family)